MLEPGAVPQLTDVQIRPPVTDEVLVRIAAVGICHTDVSVSAQVVLTFASCGECGNCSEGAPAYCDHSTALNMRGDRGDETSALRLYGTPVVGGFFGQSSFATHAIARPANTVVLPEPMAPELAAPLGCSVQTGVGTVLNALALGAADVLAVFGALSAPLPVGLIMMRGLRVRGVVEGDSDPHVFIPQLAQMWRRGDLPLGELVTTFSFDDFGDAWHSATTGGAVKPVLVMPF